MWLHIKLAVLLFVAVVGLSALYATMEWYWPNILGPLD